MGKGKIERAGKEILTEVRDEHFEHLQGVAFTVLLAYGPTDRHGMRTGPALTLHGVACLATIKAIGDEDRVAGLGDVKLKIDGDRWPQLDDDERRALLHHELCHIDWAGEVDAYQRPKLSCSRPHDHHFGWFDATARAYGKSSQEVQQATAWADKVGGVYRLGAMGPAVGVGPIGAPTRPPARPGRRPRREDEQL